MSRLLMQERERTADEAIAQAGKPAGLAGRQVSMYCRMASTNRSSESLASTVVPPALGAVLSATEKRTELSTHDAIPLSLTLTRRSRGNPRRTGSLKRLSQARYPQMIRVGFPSAPFFSGAISPGRSNE
jgi:hypothetical protein